MAEQSLFGVAVPPGAVRIVIRPVLGRGPSNPLYEARLDDDLPSESDIRAAAAKNENFWDYIDAAVKKKRITAADADCEWKLRLQFFNSVGVEESFTTDGAFEFYRSAVVGKGAEDSAEARAFERGMLLLERLAVSTEKANQGILASAGTALAEIAKAATAAISSSATAAADALKEASKQTSQVSEIAKALLEETGHLKDAIFELQTERAKAPVKAPKSMVEEIKEVVDVGRTLVTMADTFGGGSEAAKPAPQPAPPPPPPAGS